MTWLGADYSFARPGGAALKSAGVVSVGRYLATEGDGREIEKPEYDDLVAHGVTVWFVREGAASGILGGHARGVSDAQIAVANLTRLGLANQVVYAAADFDISVNQFAAADDYMRGFGSVIGVERTGIYGGMLYINHCRAAKLANWFWKAGATSWDHGQSGAIHIEQTVQTPPVAGSDHNIIYQAIHGQVGSTIPVVHPVEEEVEDMGNCAQMRYVRATDKKLVGLVADSVSGWYWEWSYNSDIANWVSAEYGAGPSLLSTESLRNTIVLACNRVTAGK